jgi:hypothetical protein
MKRRRSNSTQHITGRGIDGGLFVDRERRARPDNHRRTGFAERHRDG